MNRRNRVQTTLTAATCAALLLLGASAGAAGPAEFSAACLESTNLEKPICDCCAAKAQEELAPPAFDFVVASMEQDREATTRIRQQLSVQEAVKASMFMVSAPQRCARERRAPND